MTTSDPGSRPDAGDLEAARLLLERLGVSAADLLASPSQRPPVPTFAEYIPIVSAAVTAGTRRVYGSYWNRILEQWGGRRLDEPTPSEIKLLMGYVKAHVVARRNARGGRSAAEHLVAALRCVYRHAEDDGLISEADNPARKVDKPRRLPSTRRAVADTRLAEINHVAATTGNDAVLDTLLLRLHTETACRRGGALALRPRDLDPTQCLILLREKGETVRWQPISPTLVAHLQRHATDRHAPRDGQLLRYASGEPITRRRYDHLWTRIGRHLPWVATQQISTHWLRHTTLTWVERNFGYAVARAYAGHTDTGGDTGATSTYVRASLHEVATALAALTGEHHPLAAPAGVISMPSSAQSVPCSATTPELLTAQPATACEEGHVMPESGSGAVRVTTVAAVSVVAAVAATVSFMHMHHLAHRADEGWRAWLVPLAVDGLVVAASMTMMARRRAGKNAGWLAWVSLSAGIAASLAANVAAAQPTLIGRAVAAWPPLALLLAYELLMDQIRNARDNVATQPGKSSATVDGVVPANPSAATTAVATAEHAGMPTTTAHSTNGHAPHYPPPGDGGTLPAPAHGTASHNGSTPSSASAPHPAPPPDVPDIGAEEKTRHAARHYYRQTLADGRPCTGKQLADHFGRSERWGRYQIRAATP